jgi:hypothetical protein
MKKKHEAALSLGAAFVILIIALFDSRLALQAAVLYLIGFGLFKFLAKG